MYPYYEASQHMGNLYDLLLDDRSRRVFWARLACDIKPSIHHFLSLFQSTGLLNPTQEHTQEGWEDTMTRLQQQGKKLVLYGAGVCGEIIGRQIQTENYNFFGFCDQHADAMPNGKLGKPVISPAQLFEQADDFYVVICSTDYDAEIEQYLFENQFPADHILPYFRSFGHSFASLTQNEYFEFPEYFPPDTAFVDGGVFHAENSIRFAAWSGGKYSKIYAFEPDPHSYQQAGQALQDAGTERIELIAAALGQTPDLASFVSSNNLYSHIQTNDPIPGTLIQTDSAAKIHQIPVKRLDDVVQHTVGFIKLDVEGQEKNALRGAQQIIQRDHPLLAVCVYHRPGDMLDLMTYLHELVPEYRFYLRHYSQIHYDTVLYAVDPTRKDTSHGNL